MDITGSICLTCNEKVSSLFKRTNGSFIKLMECKMCCRIVDHYVECERSIIITDLLLQESSAYKHILYNTSDYSTQFYIKLILCIILSEGYVRWISHSTTKFGEIISIRNNEYYFYVICISFLLELVIFGIGLFILLPENGERSLNLFCKAIIWGQCGRLLNIASIVYNQGSSFVLYGFISFFVFVSSIQSMRAITFKGALSTGIDVVAALTVSVIVSRLFQGAFI